MTPVPAFAVPMSDDGILELKDIASYSIQNVGNLNVEIEGRWTLLPCGVHGNGRLEGQSNFSVRWSIKFIDNPAVTNPVKRLEIFYSKEIEKCG